MFCSQNFFRSFKRYSPLRYAKDFYLQRLDEANSHGNKRFVRGACFHDFSLSDESYPCRIEIRNESVASRSIRVSVPYTTDGRRIATTLHPGPFFATNCFVIRD